MLTAATPAEAMRAVAHDPFDVLIADHGLREGESAEPLLEMLSGRSIAPSTIQCSATPSLTEMADCRILFLAKPFDIEKLIELVTTAATSPHRPSRMTLPRRLTPVG